MKIIYLVTVVLIVLILQGCSALRVASTTENDSVYFTANDKVTYSYNYDEEESNSQVFTNREDDDDFYYSRRLNRFNTPSGSNFGYYSPYYSDSYFMYGSPYAGFYNNNLGLGGYYNPWYGNTGVWGNYYNPYGWNYGLGNPYNAWGYGGFYNTWGGGFYNNYYNSWGYGGYGGYYNPYNPWGGGGLVVIGTPSVSMPHRGSTSPMVNPQAAFNTPRPIIGRSNTGSQINPNQSGTFGGKNQSTPRVFTPGATLQHPSKGSESTPRINTNPTPRSTPRANPSPRPTPSPRAFESRPSQGGSGSGGGGRSSSGSSGGGHRPR